MNSKAGAAPVNPSAGTGLLNSGAGAGAGLVNSRAGATPVNPSAGVVGADGISGVRRPLILLFESRLRR